jgi:hypothetical protein
VNPEKDLVCGDKSVPGKTEWKLYGLSALYIDINTTNCNFPSTPVYLVNINGAGTAKDAGHWQLTGTNSVYRMNKNAFRVLISHPRIRGDELWRHAMTHKWFLSWIGILGGKAGVSRPGNTPWKQHSKYTLSLQLDTIPAVFHKTPQYFTSLAGDRMHWKVTGSHFIYEPMQGSFKIFVSDTEPVTPEMANKYKWVVMWAGSLDKTSGHSSTKLWEKDADTNTWLSQVDTTASGFKEAPAYVTSVMSGPNVNKPVHVNGADAIFAPSEKGFTLYLDNDKTNSLGLSLHVMHQFTVAYLGYSPTTNCKVSTWSSWSACDEKCGGGTTQRSRAVLVQPYGKTATKCPSLLEQKACNLEVCPTPSPTTVPTASPTAKPTLGAVDCKVSTWSSWTSCDKVCGYGVSFRNRTIYNKAARGGKACPAQVRQEHDCNKQQCVGTGTPGVCGATIPQNLMKWDLYGTDGLYTDVYSSYCKFTGMPQYIANVMGSEKHWQLTGTNSITLATKTSFRLIVIHPSLKGGALLAAATKYNWRVNWVGDDGPNSGVTNKGKSHWSASPEDDLSLFIDVKTDECNYVAQPRYFPAMHGEFNHWRTEGSHIVYLPSRTGFRVYVVYDKPITVKKANSYGWTISWIGYETDNPKLGRSDSAWVKDDSGKGLYADVDTSGNSFAAVPTYATSIHATRLHWRVSGGASIYNVKQDSFRLYLDKAMNPLFANKYHWSVNFIGYDGAVDCQFSDWSPWSKCTKECLGGTQNHTRFLTLEPYNNGKACPSVPVITAVQKCNVGACPTPAPSSSPTGAPTGAPTAAPTPPPSPAPTKFPTTKPTPGPTPPPSPSPTKYPSGSPTTFPTGFPTPMPTPLIELDCVVSSWTAWTACSKRCFGGTQTRNRIVLQAPREGAPGRPPPKQCPALKEKQFCNQGPCVGQGKSRVCGTKTLEPPYGHTPWEASGSEAIKLKIDTSFCNFTGSPRYAADVMGASAFYWRMTGSIVFTNTSATGFELMLWHPLLKAARLMAYAKRYEWRVSWIGDSGSNTGMTQPGLTGWNVHGEAESSNYLHVDVDTGGNNYTGTPRFFASIVCDRSTAKQAYKVQGGDIVYHPKKTGFRTYLMTSQELTVPMAETRKYAVQWIGVDRNDPRSGTAGDGWLASTAGTWKVDDSGAGIVMDVNTKGSSFAALLTPTYVTSIAYTGNLQWKLAGGASIYDIKPGSFRVYLGKAQIVAEMSKHAWEFMDRKYFLANYFGYEDERPRACVTSEWSLWSLCTKTCGGASKLRTRTIIKHPMFKGSPCPKLKETQPCSTKPCPVDCEVSAWTKWGECSVHCGGGQQSKSRTITRAPKFAGHTCTTKLEDTKVCNTNYCIGVGSSNVCGATTDHQTEWKLFGKTGLYIDIDASHCHFRTSPYYVITVLAKAGNWQLRGSNSITDSKKSGFRVILVHPVVKGKNLLAMAKRFKWRVAWLGDTGSNAGETVKGFTGWKEITFEKDDMILAAQKTIFADVDTKDCGFNDKTYYPIRPRYLISVHGVKNHWRVMGGHIAYNPTRKGLRVYASYDRYITAMQAEQFKWTVSWVGATDKHSGTKDGWKDTKMGLMVGVDTTTSHFIMNQPVYVVSLEATRVHWRQTDTWFVGGIQHVTAKGFDVYLNQAHNLTLVQTDGWLVNYLGYQGTVDCVLSKWSDWSVCACGLGTNQQARSRTVVQQPSTWGKKCAPNLKETKYCFRVCDTPSFGQNLTAPATGKGTKAKNNTQTQVVALSAQVNGYTSKTFVVGEQLIIRVGLGQAIGVSSNEVKIVNIRDGASFPTSGTHGRRRLTQQEEQVQQEQQVQQVQQVQQDSDLRINHGKAPSADALLSSVIVDFKVVVSTPTAARAIVAEVEAPTFAALFAAELSKFGMKTRPSSLTVSNPTVSYLVPPPKHAAISSVVKAPPKVMFQQARKVFFAFSVSACCTAHSLHSTLVAQHTRCTAHSLLSTLVALHPRCTAHSLHSTLVALHPLLHHLSTN